MQTMRTKEHILELLENHRGQIISGARIAGQLGVSRNAVWKAIKEIEKDGYKIEAVPNKGYCLCEDNDILSVQGISPFLTESGLSAFIQVHSSLESTNKTAKELALSGAKHGTVIIADYQTAGRGRYDRSFFSPPGHGIYMSFIFRPIQLNWTSLPTLVTSFAAVSVCEAIETTTGKIPQIKWVNDVFLDGKKICGILSEAVTDFESGSIQWIVVGIGVNFITPEAGYPDDIKHTAGSVFSHNKPDITRNFLAADIINRMLMFDRQPDVETMLAGYRKRLMMLGKRVVVIGLNESYEATAVDIDNIGRLIVKKDSGEILSLNSGEISLGKMD